MSDSGGEANKQEPEPVPPAGQAGGAEESRGKKPRKVAKTLLFNTPEGGEKSAAQVKLEEAVKQAADQESNKESGQAAVQQVAPETRAEAEPAVPAIDEEQLAAQAQKRAARRVAKTLLFSSTNLDDLQAKAAAAANEKAAPAIPSVSALPASPEVSAPDLAIQAQAARARKRTRKIAKTLMESDLDNFPEENLSQPKEPPQIDFSISAPAAEAPADDVVKLVPSAKPIKRERQQFVAKTMLDHSILWDTVSKFEAKMEVKIAEQIAERAAEPVKMLVPIECKKQAMACGFKWDDTETKERFRYCALCKTPVYNFAGLEMPEAEEIVFQRENKKKFTLFKRPDGKFMTVDCPVEVKRKRDTILLSVGGVMLVLCALAFMILMPKPPKPEPQTQAVQAPVQPGLATGPGENRGTNSSSKHPTIPATGATVNDGSFHMVNGQRVYPTAGTAPVTFPAPQQPAVTSDADESGDFWQYDGPPNAAPPVQPQPVEVPPVPVQPQQQNSSFAPQQVQQQYPQPATDVAVPKPTNGAQLKQAGETPAP